MKIEAVLFDATGVLIEPEGTVGQRYAEIARTQGATLPAWRIEDAFRRVLRGAPPRVFPGLPAEAVAAAERRWWRERVRETFQAADSTLRFPDFDALFDALYQAFAQADAWRERPGVRESLRILRDRGLATGVVSNFDHRLPGILEGLGIAELLDVIAIPSRCGAAKPDAAIFQAALAGLGVGAGEAVYVGHDPVLDLAAASAAGLIPLALPAAEGLSALPARLERLANLGA